MKKASVSLAKFQKYHADVIAMAFQFARDFAALPGAVELFRSSLEFNKASINAIRKGLQDPQLAQRGIEVRNGSVVSIHPLRTSNTVRLEVPLSQICDIVGFLEALKRSVESNELSAARRSHRSYLALHARFGKKRLSALDKKAIEANA